MSNSLYFCHNQVTDIIIVKGTSMAFSRYCLELRRKKELSQLELSEILGLSFSQLRNLEKERTKLPKPEVFQRLAEYLGKDVFDVAYDVFFNDDGQKMTDDPSIEINRNYLVSRWLDGYMLDPNICFTADNGRQMQFDGSFWAPSHGRRKCLIGYCHQDAYLSALDDLDKTNSLKKAIISDSFFIETLDDTDSIKEVRFVLDKNSETDRHIFSEIKNIHLFNLGKNIDISYVLFDSNSKRSDSQPELHYVTGRSSKIDL